VRTTTALRALSSFALVALLTTPAADTWAGDPKDAAAKPGSDEASTRFRSGVAFYNDKDFQAALVEFKRAYELAPNYKVLFNLGQTSRELDDYATALSAFEQYLREGGNEILPARRKDVRSFIDELKKKVGTITVETNVEGAEILVDDLPRGVTPLAAPVLVNVGRRKFSATLKGYNPTQRVVEVAGMEQSTVGLELTKIDKPVELPKPDPSKPPPEAETPVAAWVVFSATAASAIVTGVMGGLALSARSDLDAALAAFPGDAAAIDDAQSRTNTFALSFDIVGAVTIAGAVTTVILFVLAPGSSADEPKAKATVQLSPSGFGVRGAF